MTIANAVASSSWDEEDVICLGSGSSDDVIDVDDNSGNMDLEDEEPDEYTAMVSPMPCGTVLTADSRLGLALHR